MKANEPRPPVKHELEHAVETHIHDPEQDMNALERWLRHELAHPVRFWGTVVGLAVVLVSLSLLTNGLSSTRTTTNEAWAKLETAKTASERVEIAKDFKNTPVEQWALLQAATEFYNQGLNDLPSNQEVAKPTLRKALDLFEKVAAESPADSPQARSAAIGLARTLEARNELPRAIAQYEKVVKTWPGTTEAREAEHLAALLKRPEAENFYKELYAFKPPAATLPAGGSSLLDLPLPSTLGSPGAAIPPPTGSADPKSSLFTPMIPPPPISAPAATTTPAKTETPVTIDLQKGQPAATPPAAPATKKDEFPDNAFTPPAGTGKAAETPKK
ncbi:MAG: tetratricopeptide repeat protein [Isosphaeraceae bacterium]